MHGWRVLLFVMCVSPVWSQCELRSVVEIGGEPGDDFGQAVAISGEIGVVAAPRDDEVGTDSGSVSIYRRIGSTWQLEEKLTAPNAGPSEIFGHSVATSGELVLAARYDLQNGLEVVHVYRRTGSQWLEEGPLTASDGTGLQLFGFSVSVSGDVAVIGAVLDDEAGFFAGSAYVFRHDGTAWVEETKLLPSDSEFMHRFGAAVSVVGDVAMVSAVGDDDETGAVYVFVHDNGVWQETQKLTASDGTNADFFGSSLSLSASRVVVASPLDDGAGVNRGSTYVFGKMGNQWVEEAKLVASDAADHDQFGSSVAL